MTRPEDPSSRSIRKPDSTELTTFEPITAAGGVLVDPTTGRILLIRRNGFWDLPKGKQEEGESIEEAAVREVMEEVGVPEPRLGSRICETRHRYVLEGRAMEKTTHWFVMLWPEGSPSSEHPSGAAADYPFQPQSEEGISEVAWEEPETARAMVAFDNLSHVLERFMEMKKG